MVGDKQCHSRLIVICGLPGTGKTTYATRLETSLPAVRLSADDWMHALGINLWDEPARERIESLQWTLAKRLLELGTTVLIEWGTWGRSERDKLREGAAAIGASVELHYLTARLDVLFERISRRRLEDPPITREQLEQYAKSLQEPTQLEGTLYDNFLTITTDG